MKFHKRQLILASLIVALGAAVYLNWQMSDDHSMDNTEAIESTSELGEARYVNTSNISEKPDNIQSSEPAGSQTEAFFAQIKANRQKSRDESFDKLKSLISAAEKNTEVKEQLKERVDDLTKNVQEETNIESLVKAKGFGDCVAYIQNGECSIVVSPGNLNENTAIIISDIATGQTGISHDKIKITESK